LPKHPGGAPRKPFDWIISKNGKAAFIDTKTINNKAFPNSFIDVNQVTEFLKHAKERIEAGYVINLRTINQLIFVPATTLSLCVQSRGSINQDTHGVITLGTNETMDIEKIFLLTEANQNRQT